MSSSGRADGAVGAGADVRLSPDQVERPNAYGLPRARVGGAPRPLRYLEDEYKGRHKALQGHAADDDLGCDGQVVEALAHRMIYRFFEAPGREADVGGGE